MKPQTKYYQRMIVTTFLMGIQYVYGMGESADNWDSYSYPRRGLKSAIVQVLCKGGMVSESPQSGEEETWVETVTGASRIGRL